MANFPTSYDSLVDPVSGQPRNTVGMTETGIISSLNDAVEKIELYIGTSSETSVATITGKVKQFDKATTKGDLLYHDGTSLTRLPRGSNGYLLSSDATDGLKYIAPTSGGTVTNTSIVSTNGFTGSVVNPTTTPAITIGTSITGLLKGNGTAVSSATQGTDYYAPSGTDVGVSDGGTGVSTLTTFAPIFGGTTATGPIQQVAVGTNGQVLTSNGTGALATFQNAPLPTIGLDNNAHSDGNHTGFGSAVYSITIPAGTVITGKGLRIRGIYNSYTFGFGDYRDDNVITPFIGGTALTGNILLGTRNIPGTAYGEFEIIIYGVSSASQRTTVGSNYFHGAAGYGRRFTRDTTAIDMSVSQTIDFKFGFEYANASITSTLESITIEKL